MGRRGAGAGSGTQRKQSRQLAEPQAARHSNAGTGRPAAKMLALADKLSNLRSIARDYQSVGDALWERFHAPKEKQAWYYNGILNALAPLQDLETTAALYEELTEHYKDVLLFIKLRLPMINCIRPIPLAKPGCLTKGNPQWQPTTYRFRQNDIPLTRQGSGNPGR